MFDGHKMHLIDWGLADFYLPDKRLSSKVASRYYKAPELLLGLENYHYAVDIWSAGCIMAEIMF